jgi:UDPglucose 6-dehydrogenase
MIKIGEQAGYDFKILKSVVSINEQQRKSLVAKIKAHYGSELKGKKAAIWGLAFKPDTDDIREAPALYIIEELLKAGVTVSAFDPEAANNVKHLLGNKVSYGKDEYEVLQDADFLVIATEWALFRTPDFERIASSMKSKTIFDGRNLYDLKQMEELGFHYNSVGRETIGN